MRFFSLWIISLIFNFNECFPTETHISIAIKAVYKILAFERAKCYIANAQSNGPIQVLLFNEYIPKDDLALTTHGCSDHSIIFVNDFNAFSKMNLTQFRMYIVINLMKGERPENVFINNVVWLQYETNSLYSVYEKKRGKMMKMFIWNGNYFLDLMNMKKQSLFERNVKGELLRLGTTIFPPHTLYKVNDEGHLVEGFGVEVNPTL